MIMKASFTGVTQAYPYTMLTTWCLLWCIIFAPADERKSFPHTPGSHSTDLLTRSVMFLPLYLRPQIRVHMERCMGSRTSSLFRLVIPLRRSLPPHFKSRMLFKDLSEGELVEVVVFKDTFSQAFDIFTFHKQLIDRFIDSCNVQVLNVMEILLHNG